MKKRNCLIVLLVLIGSASSASVRNFINNEPPDQHTPRDQSSYHTAQLSPPPSTPTATAGNGIKSSTPVESSERQEAIHSTKSLSSHLNNSLGIFQIMIVNKSNWVELVNLAGKSTPLHKCKMMFIKLKPKPNGFVLEYNCTQSSRNDSSVEEVELTGLKRLGYDGLQKIGKETDNTKKSSPNNNVAQLYGDGAIGSGSRIKRDIYYKNPSFYENRPNVSWENIYSSKNVTVGMNFEGFTDRDDLEDVDNQSTPDCKTKQNAVPIPDDLKDTLYKKIIIATQPHTAEYRREECVCEKSETQATGTSNNHVTRCDCRKNKKYIHTITQTEDPSTNQQSGRPVDMEVKDIIDEHYGLPGDTIQELLDIYNKSNGKYRPKVIFLPPLPKQNQSDSVTSPAPIGPHQWQYFRSFSKDPQDKTPADFPDFFKWLEQYGYKIRGSDSDKKTKTSHQDSSSIQKEKDQTVHDENTRTVLPVQMDVHEIITGKKQYGISTDTVKELLNLYKETGGKYRPKVIFQPLRPKTSESNPIPLPRADTLKWQYFRSFSQNPKDKTPMDFASFSSWKEKYVPRDNSSHSKVTPQDDRKYGRKASERKRKGTSDIYVQSENRLTPHDMPLPLKRGEGDSSKATESAGKWRRPTYEKVTNNHTKENSTKYISDILTVTENYVHNAAKPDSEENNPSTSSFIKDEVTESTLCASTNCSKLIAENEISFN